MIFVHHPKVTWILDFGGLCLDLNGNLQPSAEQLQLPLPGEMSSQSIQIVSLVARWLFLLLL